MNLKPLSNKETKVKQSHLNDDILSIVKSFVDYFESVDEEIAQDEAEGRKE